MRSGKTVSFFFLTFFFPFLSSFFLAVVWVSPSTMVGFTLALLLGVTLDLCAGAAGAANTGAADLGNFRLRGGTGQVL